jgi:hypothetical protein
LDHSAYDVNKYSGSKDEDFDDPSCAEEFECFGNANRDVKNSFYMPGTRVSEAATNFVPQFQDTDLKDSSPK